MVEQFASIDKSKDQVELFRGLEGEFERHNERIVDLCQYRAFGKSVGNLGARDDVSFANRLEGVNSMSVTLSDSILVGIVELGCRHNSLYLHDLTKAAFANDF